jgi:hypothetical protein
VYVIVRVMIVPVLVPVDVVIVASMIVVKVVAVVDVVVVMVVVVAVVVVVGRNCLERWRRRRRKSFGGRSWDCFFAGIGTAGR